MTSLAIDLTITGILIALGIGLILENEIGGGAVFIVGGIATANQTAHWGWKLTSCKGVSKLESSDTESSWTEYKVFRWFLLQFCRNKYLGGTCLSH